MLTFIFRKIRLGKTSMHTVIILKQTINYIYYILLRTNFLTSVNIWQGMQSYLQELTEEVKWDVIYGICGRMEFFTHSEMLIHQACIKNLLCNTDAPFNIISKCFLRIPFSFPFSSNLWYVRHKDNKDTRLVKGPLARRQERPGLSALS